jgi:hypothetical protein
MVDGLAFLIKLLSSSPAPDMYAGGKAAALASQQACLLVWCFCGICLNFTSLLTVYHPLLQLPLRVFGGTSIMVLHNSESCNHVSIVRS